MQPSSPLPEEHKSGKLPRAISFRNLILPVVIFLVLIFIYWPVLRWLVNSWLSSDYYSHGFLVPVVSAIIVWTKRGCLKVQELSLSGIFWILLATMLYALNITLEIRVLGVLSLLILIFGLVWLVWGTRTVKSLVFPLIFLIFLVPFPFIPDLAFRLQEISVFSSSHLLEILGLPITSSGMEIYLQTTVFTVGIPCSGINSLIALLALSAVYSYALKGLFSKRAGLFILAFPIAIFANILRIVSIILVAYFVNVQTAAGWYHDLSSPLFFLLSFLIIILAGWIMKCKINYHLLERQ
jgi:exosortase